MEKQPSLVDYMRNEEAQRAFAEGGERAYVDYVYAEVQRRRKAGEKIAETMVVIRGDAAPDNPDDDTGPYVVARKKPGDPGQPPAPPPSRALVARPLQVTGTKDNGGRADKQPEPRYKKKIIDQPVSPEEAAKQRAGKIRATKDQRFPRRARFRVAQEHYSDALATRRSSGIDNLAEGNRLRRTRNLLLSLIDTIRATGARRRSEQARHEYENALDEYMGNLALRDVVKDRGKVRLMSLFERKVMESQTRQAGATRDANSKLLYPDTRDTRRAEDWLDSDQRYKVGWIVWPGVAVGGLGGIVGGAATASTGVIPTAVIGGVGTVVAAAGGAAWGGHLARRANRGQAATEEGHKELDRDTEDRIRQIKSHFTGTGKDDLKDSKKITARYEQKTDLEHQNEHRTVRAKQIGAIAAGGTFLALFVSAKLVEAVARNIAQYGSVHNQAPAAQQAASTPTTGGNGGSTPATTGGSLNTPPLPANITHTYPWNVAAQYNAAHHLSTSPSTIWDTLHHAADLYNQTHPGAHYHYVLHGTKYWLQNSAQTPTWAVNADFNKFLWYITSHS